MLVATILSGGAGARLWPVSREAHPKLFRKLPDGKSPLQKTYFRAAGLPDLGEVLTVTNQELCLGTKEDYKQVHPTEAAFRESFPLEPFGRNTGPAIALAELKTDAEHGPNATMLVLPPECRFAETRLWAVHRCTGQFVRRVRGDQTATFPVFADGLRARQVIAGLRESIASRGDVMLRLANES